MDKEIKKNNMLSDVGIDKDSISGRSLKKFFGALKFNQVVIAFSNSNYLTTLGGTEKVLLEEQLEMAKHHISYIHICPDDPRYRGPDQDDPAILLKMNVDSVPVGKFTFAQLSFMLCLLQLNRTITIAALHIHHMLNLSVSGIKFFIDTVQAAILRVFIHDYYTMCPQLNLTRHGNKYCHMQCQYCQYKEQRVRRISDMQKLFAGMNTEFIAPSSLVAEIWSESYPEYADKVRIVPHQIAQPSNRLKDSIMERTQRLKTADSRPRLAFLGFDYPKKGSEIWQHIVSDSELDKKYEFYHLGAASSAKPNISVIPVSF